MVLKLGVAAAQIGLGLKLFHLLLKSGVSDQSVHSADDNNHPCGVHLEVSVTGCCLVFPTKVPGMERKATGSCQTSKYL